MTQLSSHERKLLKALNAGLLVHIYKGDKFVAVTKDRKRFEISSLTVNSLIGKALLRDTSNLKFLELTDLGKEKAERI